MSVAFTKEEDSESNAANLLDRPISPHPNLVTPSGLTALDAALAKARADYAAAQAGGAVSADRTAMARATRDLRYYSARRASAQLVEPGAEAGKLSFGGVVTFEREDGRRQSFRIVGEDEADPAKGRCRTSRRWPRRCWARGGRRGHGGGAEVEVVGWGGL